MNAYSLRKNVIIHVLVASGMTRHDCLFQRFIADDTICIHLLVKSLTLDQINKKKDVSLNLANYCNMLNLTNNGKWHDALDDAIMIKKICTLYLNVLTQPLEKKHEAETIDRSPIYSVDTGNEEPEKETLPTNAIVLD